MKFHCILCTKNCADIIVESLQSKADWADFVYVYDTGSTDGTWELVRDFARKDQRVVPFGQEVVLFHEGVRSYVFNAFRSNMQDGDWVVKCDEDEFFHISPREFVSKHLRPYETAVWSQTYEFRLTWSEAVQQCDPGRVKEERRIPVWERRRYYIPLEYSEHRLCQYRKDMKWHPMGSFVTNAGFVARARIPLRHYPHRDIEQLKERVRFRKALLKVLPAGTYPHWRCDNWEDFIVSNNFPGLRYWTPGEALPDFWFPTHLRKWPVRIAQWALHRFAVRLLDRLRQPYPISKPKALPAQVLAELNETDTSPRMGNVNAMET